MTFTKNDTLVAKGIAVILLLIHHLFYSKDYGFSSFLLSRTDWVNLAKISKICVAMFLILSGYGLAASYRKKMPKALSFYGHSFSRLYGEFLPVSVLFFLISLCLNDWNLAAIYGKRWLLSNLRSVLGLSYFSNIDGINGSWWFISLLIVLYFLFPLLYKIVQKVPLETVVVSLLLFYLPPHFTNENYFLKRIFKCLLLKSDIQGPLTCWLNPFIIGIAMERLCFFERIKIWEYKTKTFCFFFSFVILAYMRLVFLRGHPSGHMTGVDSFIAVSLITFVWLSVHGTAFKILAFVGKHSMNIYFVHIFIMLVYLKNITYILKYPPLILLQLLLICLSFSVVLEKTKEVLRQFLKREKKNLSPPNEMSIYSGNGGNVIDSGKPD